MNELITRLTDHVGIDTATAEKAVGLILAFLQEEGPRNEVAAFIAAIPNAQELIAQAGHGGLLSSITGGVMGLGSKLMATGLSMGEITSVSKETISYAKEKAGAENVDAVINSIPGLSQFL